MGTGSSIWCCNWRDRSYLMRWWHGLIASYIRNWSVYKINQGKGADVSTCIMSSCIGLDEAIAITSSFWHFTSPMSIMYSKYLIFSNCMFLWVKDKLQIRFLNVFLMYLLRMTYCSLWNWMINIIWSIVPRNILIRKQAKPIRVSY